MNKRLNTAQKEELGAKLVQAVSEGMDLVNNHTAKETAWVQFYEFDPENWYAPANVAGADPNSRIQLDVIAPQKMLSTPEDTRAVLSKAAEAVRSVFGPGPLPAHGPWVHVYTIPVDQFGVQDGRVPDWEGLRRRNRQADPWSGALTSSSTPPTASRALSRRKDGPAGRRLDRAD
jgi:phenylpyruvate tautomerase PptA (4-oxalocrotonate tautomerase family)